MLTRRFPFISQSLTFQVHSILIKDVLILITFPTSETNIGSIGIFGAWYLALSWLTKKQY